MSSEEKSDHAGDDNVQLEYYRHMFQCSSFAVIGTDCQGIIVSWNEAAEKLFGSEQSHMLGHHIETIITDDKKAALQDAIERAVIDQQSTEFETSHAKSSTEDSVALSVVISPVLDDNKEILGVSAWIRDISNRKNLQKQLVHAEKMASMGTLASGVAHHFNNIIGGVATFVDYALTTRSPQGTQQALKMTADAAERISKITSSLLTFAEMDIRQFDMADLTEVFLTFANLIEKPLLEKNIRLELNIQPVPVHEVPGSRIHQMLGNLLDNAECAMPEGGVISLELFPRNMNTIMIIKDNGSGIKPEVLPHIFDPFYTTRGTMVGGEHKHCSGLGLAVVHGIVRELGATISVDSTVGVGTTFTIVFPQSKRLDD